MNEDTGTALFFIFFGVVLGALPFGRVFFKGWPTGTRLISFMITIAINTVVAISVIVLGITRL